jgi:hypothetical protein
MTGNYGEETIVLASTRPIANSHRACASTARKTGGLSFDTSPGPAEITMISLHLISWTALAGSLAATAQGKRGIVFSTGDAVIVPGDDAQSGTAKTSIRILKKTGIQISESRGTWIADSMEVDGRKHQGWIPPSKVGIVIRADRTAEMYLAGCRHETARRHRLRSGSRSCLYRPTATM